MKNLKCCYIVLAIFAVVFFSCSNSGEVKKVWSQRDAKRWQKDNDWLRGCNFIPSNAVNQLEMWQEGTFDPETIQRELSWAREIGFNCVRVYLHHLAWKANQTGFKFRMDQYLRIANDLGIKTIFVFFDDCWNPRYSSGPQPNPIPGVHNSGWLRDPGDVFFQDSTMMGLLEEYVKDVLVTFGKDRRIVLWDLYNEPGNSGYGEKSLNLLTNIFQWGWDIRPDQPLTSGLWTLRFPVINKFLVEHSDILTYHNYDEPKKHQEALDTLLNIGRPLVCTEYMARSNNSMFQNIMPLLKENNVGAINWGLVAGKTNTIYSWWEQIPDGSEPDVWFHDIFRTDGTPYRQEEIDCIRDLTKGD